MLQLPNRERHQTHVLSKKQEDYKPENMFFTFQQALHRTSIALCVNKATSPFFAQAKGIQAVPLDRHDYLTKVPGLLVPLLFLFCGCLASNHEMLVVKR